MQWAALQQRLQTERRLILCIRAAPGAAKTECTGVMADGALKIRVHAAPEKGQANTELIDYLAQSLGVAPRQIVLMAGAAARTKRLLITL